jgi:uncharacterized protein YaaR (DUF327 family)
MDKVDFPSSALINPSLHPGLKPGPKKTKAKSDSTKKTIFSKLLENSVFQTGELGPLSDIIPSEEALAELMDAVHSAGSDLIDRPYHDEILKYKKAVRNFIHYVVDNAFTVEKSQTRRRELKNLHPHVQIQIIDRKLEELAAAILSGQTTQLERVSKLDELKGLLVDFTISGVIKERND